MLCVVRIVDGVPTEWFIATDMPDARRQAQATGEMILAEKFYRMEFVPPVGKYDLGNHIWLLVT